MNLVGIDFSINSPSFCCLKDNNYVWGSLTRSDRTEDSLKKNSKKPFSVLGDMENLRFIFLNKKELPSEYSERERIKIEYFLEIVDNLWEGIVNEMGNEPFRVAMEGLSFSSNGNSLVDIAMATALLRERIINKMTLNPAKIHKLYPQKGVIAEGSDADIFIYKLKEQKITKDHGFTDYDIYRGLKVKGEVVSTILRGKFIVRNGLFKNNKGQNLN